MVTVLLPTIRITKIHYDDHTTKMIIDHAYPHNQDDHEAAGEGRRQTHLARPSWSRRSSPCTASPLHGPYFQNIVSIITWCPFLSLFGKMSSSFHSFSSHSSQNESGMRKWPKNDNFRPEWDWPHHSHFISFISFWGHPKPRMTVEWGKTSFSSHFRGITKPNFPSSEKCFNFRTVGIEGQTNDTEWLGNDKNDCGMIGMSPKWDEWRKNDVDDCHIIWIDQKWDEWRSNDMNEYKMRWMTLKWDKWLWNDMNESWMMWMTVKWYEWV